MVYQGLWKGGWILGSIWQRYACKHHRLHVWKRQRRITPMGFSLLEEGFDCPEFTLRIYSLICIATWKSCCFDISSSLDLIPVNCSSNYIPITLCQYFKIPDVITGASHRAAQKGRLSKPLQPPCLRSCSGQSKSP